MRRATRHSTASAVLLLFLPLEAARGATIPPEEVRQVTQEVLALPLFNPRKTPVQKWIDAALEKIEGFLGRVAEWLFSRGDWGEVPKILSTIAVVVALALLALILLLVTIAIFRRMHGNSRLDESLGEYMQTEDLSPDRLLAAAAEAADSGDHARAFRLVYLAALLSLDRAGLVRFDRSRANWEYVRDVRRAGRGFAPTLASLTSEFDHKVYGGGDITSSDYQASLAAYSSITDSLRSAA